jgi:hypothetical protein
MERKENLDNSDFELEAKKEYLLPCYMKPSETFKFKDYAPHVFDHIRSMKITPEKFLESWSITASNKMNSSTARSGSMFFNTEDKIYLFKTILHPEVAAMMNLLKDYYQHLKKNPNTFMVHIYGMFRAIHTNILGAHTKQWILIMGNTFSPQIKMDSVFDLKGRFPKPGKSIDERGIVSNGAKKDNEISQKILLRPASKCYFTKQIECDIALLSNKNIMDYSLLIGTHIVTEDEKARARYIYKLRLHRQNKLVPLPEIETLEAHNSNENNSNNIDNEKTEKVLGFKTEKAPLYQGLTKEEEGLIESYKITADDITIYELGLCGFTQDGFEAVFFVGIIDCLTAYTKMKQTATLFKSLLWDEQTLSTVAANFYAERFLHFMTKILLADESDFTIQSDFDVSFAEHCRIVDDKRKSQMLDTNGINGMNLEQQPTIIATEYHIDREALHQEVLAILSNDSSLNINLKSSLKSLQLSANISSGSLSPRKEKHSKSNLSNSGKNVVTIIPSNDNSVIITTTTSSTNTNAHALPNDTVATNSSNIANENTGASSPRGSAKSSKKEKSERHHYHHHHHHLLLHHENNNKTSTESVPTTSNISSENEVFHNNNKTSSDSEHTTLPHLIIKDHNSHSEGKEEYTFSLNVADAVSVGNHTAYRVYLTTNHPQYSHFPFANPGDESRCFEKRYLDFEQLYWQLKDYILNHFTKEEQEKHKALIHFKLPPKLLLQSKFHPQVIQDRLECFRELVGLMSNDKYIYLLPLVIDWFGTQDHSKSGLVSIRTIITSG